ncbi:helix-turn-helix domain-containing protein [Plantactinospora alkalitolerans]|uniref:helix-turn-helix domain-containing protein n=1 Tax=Plantactinospora alkalitolerans TaxID=2789879 RepID=UPI002B20D462|nr:helix-turn-helix transcriptional regulator [Plantactinospora alkalitolerans]
MGISTLEFLLRELRRRRVAAGLTQAALGERIHFSDTHVSAVETGTKPLKGDYVKAVDDALGAGGALVEMWEDLVRDGSAPVWFRDWLEIERRAVMLRWFETTYVPGLLQTEAYARATLAGERLTPAEVDQFVAARLERQSILTRERPPLIAAVIDEAVIVRGAEEARPMMAEQVARIVGCAQLPNVQLQVVSTGVGMYPGYGGPFTLAELPDNRRVGHADNQLAARIVDGPDDVATLVGRWERIRGYALPVDQSLELIKKVATSWS